MTKYLKIGLLLVAISGIGIGLYRVVGSNLPKANPNIDRVAFLTDSSFPRLSAWVRKRSIEVVNIDSPGLTQVIQDEDILWGLDWSLDGNYIAYFDVKPGNLYRIAVDGSSQPELLLPKTYGVHPSWSPDGSQIAYASSGEILLFNLTSKQIISLLGNTDGSHPDWSPDGRKIVFTQNPAGMIDGPPSSIAIINVDGSGLVQLTPDDWSVFPRWSPDGRKILFQREGNIYVMNSDGNHIQALTKDGESFFPAWSPDGTKIVFISYVNRECGFALPEHEFCNNEVRVMNSDGSNIVVLQNEKNENYASPVWAPSNN